MLAPLFILGITGFCLTNKCNFHTIKYMHSKYLKPRNNIFEYIIAHFIEYIVNYII